MGGNAALSTPVLDRLRDQVLMAQAAGTPLRIRGADSKSWYGNPVTGQMLDTRDYKGVVAYDPAELVITACCGTPLADIEATVAECGQMLPFEPPHFGASATLGGCVAAGLAGPRRPYAGAIRDFVLGVTIMNGRGEVMRFGGQVMKNVAGYDVARLMAGSLGTLGLILEVSLRLLPVPVATRSLRFVMDENQAIETLNHWAGKPVPMSASAWHEGELMLRLSGSHAGVEAAVAQLGGDFVAEETAQAYWQALREQSHDFFAPQAAQEGTALWRVAVPPTTPALALEGAQWLEWGGGQRWWRTHEPAAEIRRIADLAGGHATLFRSGAGAEQGVCAFSSLPGPMATIQRRLKAVFDPSGIFNPHRIDPRF
ncbi:glycolate oxidase subunit GlcE [Silvimonas iriomotensis]|uniref:Glycolate oxidase subunit GlcE n=1 Tax=Silvimonas iriomotensis TaxID=449662 RepID=A0ABQ2P5H6_9NEIS|nr:glycolate oxidase subunit GlcE [Silvimonas iriomotensis]GGP18523.1 glycolate oxidase subunit GlcE [Silvimonas iriomotensis]